MLRKFIKRAGLLIAVAILGTMALKIYDIEAVHASAYWIKVNKQANVATVYKNKKGKWMPIRAMLTSCGGYKTPAGTFRTSTRYRWHTLAHDLRGQYCTRIVGHILFHSVWYFPGGSYGDQSLVQFNRLGSTASDGCVRLCTMDAKWIYDHCGYGTKVTIYSSSNPGPLGKPKNIKVSGYRGWDPTDPHPANPRFRMRAPKIYTTTKKRTVYYGRVYSLMSKMKAFNPNANQVITDRLRVSKVERLVRGNYIKSKFKTTLPGKYRVTYYVYDPYSTGAKRTITIKVLKKYENSKPRLYVYRNKTISLGDTRVFTNIEAKVYDGPYQRSVKKYINTIMTDPEGNVTKIANYKELNSIVFDKLGEYEFNFTIKNPFGKKVTTLTKKIFIENDGSDEPEENIENPANTANTAHYR